jgi:glycosyltransferase involved in cell wall biosynthesis
MMTYNHENYISKAIEGVLMQQTSFPVELIVANDHSTDLTEEIVKGYRQKAPHIVKGYYNKKNLGPRHNFIKAYGYANGTYIAMCEGDDYWTDPFKLQKQVNFLEENQDYVLSFHDIKMIDSEGNGLKSKKLEDENKHDYKINELLSGPYLPTPTLCYRKFDIAKYQTYFKRAFNGDTLLLSILTQKGKTRYLADIFGSCVRIHNKGIWSSKNYLDKWNCSLTTFLIIFSSLDKERKRQVFDKYVKIFEMASWDADYYQSKRYWLLFNLKYVRFCLGARDYGKVLLISGRLFMKYI